MAARRGGEHEAMQELVRELRKENHAELDWEALEGRLLKQVAREPRMAAPAPRMRAVFALAAVLVAVVAVIGARALLRSEPALGPSAPKAAAPRVFGPEVISPLHGNALAAGDRVRTGRVPIRVEHRAHSSWVLAAGSAVTVLSVGEVVRLRLDTGSLTAEVTHAERPESFVVQAGATRIAVHGTRFTVQRRQARVLVQVTEGVVAVSSERAAGGSEERWLLQAPARGDFSEDGSGGHVIAREVAERNKPHATRSRAARRAPAQAPEAPSAATSVEPSAVEAPPELVPEQQSADSSAQASPPVELPAKPSIGDVEAGLTQVIDTLSACFQQHMPARGDMRVTARTTLTLSVLADGRIAKSQFDPPLAPNVSLCALNASATIHFAASREGVVLTRILELRR